jgi:hypothetical protein
VCPGLETHLGSMAVTAVKTIQLICDFASFNDHFLPLQQLMHSDAFLLSLATVPTFQYAISLLQGLHIDVEKSPHYFLKIPQS